MKLRDFDDPGQPEWKAISEFLEGGSRSRVTQLFRLFPARAAAAFTRRCRSGEIRVANYPEKCLSGVSPRCL